MPLLFLLSHGTFGGGEEMYEPSQGKVTGILEMMETLQQALTFQQASGLPSLWAPPCSFPLLWLITSVLRGQKRGRGNSLLRVTL